MHTVLVWLFSSCYFLNIFFYGYIDPFTRIFLRAQIAKSMGPTWGPPGSCRPQMGPMLAQWTLLSGGDPWLFDNSVAARCLITYELTIKYMGEIDWCQMVTKQKKYEPCAIWSFTVKWHERHAVRNTGDSDGYSAADIKTSEVLFTDPLWGKSTSHRRISRTKG